jgi:choline dehydrogenase-like flavoprotein
MFILGSTVFPTSATGNPTLTIAALSLRAVASVKAALHS